MSDEEAPKKKGRTKKVTEEESPKRKSNSWTPERKAVNKSETQFIKDKMGAMAEKMNKLGRPTDYDPAIAAKFCRVISQEPLSVEAICKKYPDEFPHQSCIFGWIVDHPEFEDMYRSAKRHQMHLFVEQIIDISDDDEGFVDQVKIQHSKLRIDTRKWVASKLAPRIYGDTPKIDERTSQESLLALQANIMALLMKKNEREY